MKYKIVIFIFGFVIEVFSQSIAMYTGAGSTEIVWTDNQSSIDKTTFMVKGTNTYKTYFYWGDGTSTEVTFTTGNVTVEKTYSSTGTYSARISGNLDKLTSLICTENHVVMDLFCVQNATELTFLHLSGSGFRGTINALNPLHHLTYLYLNSPGMAFTGDLNNIANLTSLTTLHLQNTVCTGAIDKTEGMVSLVTLYLDGTGYSGDLVDFQSPLPQTFENLDSLTFYQTDIAGTMSDIEDLYPNLVYLNLYSTTITEDVGDFASATEIISMRYLSLLSNTSMDSTTTANVSLLDNLTFFEFDDSNDYDFTGDLSSITGLGSLATFDLHSYSAGSNFTGGYNDLSGLTSLTLLGFPSGNTGMDTYLSLESLKPLTSLITLYAEAGDASPSYCGASAIPASWKYLYFTNSVFTGGSSVDSLLIRLDSAGGSSGILEIDGSCPARTSASDAAVASLQGKGWTITE